jgi:CRP-like cAMP-binding protein
LEQAGLNPDHQEHLQVFDRFGEALEWSEDRVLERARAQLQQRGGGVADDGFLDAVFTDVMAALDVQEEFEDLVRILRPQMEVVEAEEGTTLFEQHDENRRLYFIVGGLVTLEKTDFQGSPARVGTLGRWNLVGELGAFLEYREPFSARVEQSGEIFALPADALVALFTEEPELAQRLQRLAIQMMGSKLKKATQTLAEP